MRTLRFAIWHSRTSRFITDIVIGLRYVEVFTGFHELFARSVVSDANTEHRGQTPNNLVKRFAAVFTQPDRAVGHADEKCVGLLRIARRRAGRGFEMFRQSAGKSSPGLPLVVAPKKSGCRAFGPVPEWWGHRRGRRKKHLGSRRMADQLRHVATIESVTGLNEAIAAVGAFVHALAGSRDHHGWIVRHHRDGVSVELDTCFDILPALAPVLTANDPAFFNGAKDDLRIIRPERKSFDVAHVGRTRESPIDGFGQVSEPLAVDPTLAAVHAIENGRRTGADKQLGAFRMLDHTPSFFIKDAVVDLAPTLATV